MTEKEFVEKNIRLSFEFSKYVLANPELDESIPNNAQVVFLIEDDPEFNKKSKSLAEKQREPGQPVVIVKIKGLAPPLVSRLIEPKLELVSAP